VVEVAPNAVLVAAASVCAIFFSSRRSALVLPIDKRPSLA
jgi:hypothetical protein